MRVVLTGGAGAIGSNLARALLARGDDVIILDDLSSGHVQFVPPGAQLIEGSVESRQDVRAAFVNPVDAVVHLAALFANQNSVEHPQEDLLTNGLGTINVLEASLSAEVRSVVNVSSSCVYGARHVMREGDPIDLLDTPYAITKLVGEHYAAWWGRHHGLPAVSVRLFNVYGPYELPGQYRNVIPNFIATALAGDPLTITGNGDETRDFTFVTDTVQGILAVLDADLAPGEIFNIASGRETSIRWLAEMINQLTGNMAGIRYVERRSWDHVSRRVGDIRHAHDALGYTPLVEVADGLARTVEWLRAALAE